MQVYLWTGKGRFKVHGQEGGRGPRVNRLGFQGNDPGRMQVYLWTGKGRFKVMDRKEVKRPMFGKLGYRGSWAMIMSHAGVPVDGQGALGSRTGGRLRA